MLVKAKLSISPLLFAVFSLRILRLQIARTSCTLFYKQAGITKFKITNFEYSFLRWQFIETFRLTVRSTFLLYCTFFHFSWPKDKHNKMMTIFCIFTADVKKSNKFSIVQQIKRSRKIYAEHSTQLY